MFSLLSPPPLSRHWQDSQGYSLWIDHLPCSPRHLHLLREGPVIGELLRLVHGTVFFLMSSLSSNLICFSSNCFCSALTCSSLASLVSLSEWFMITLARASYSMRFFLILLASTNSAFVSSISSRAETIPASTFLWTVL